MGYYKISRRARANLRGIWFYGLERWGEAAADRYETSLHQHFAQIAEYPHLFPAAENAPEGYRRSVCGRETVYYRITDDGVEIMAILGQQNHGDWF